MSSDDVPGGRSVAETLGDALSRLAARLAARDDGARVDVVPPVALEFALNGGPNPLIGRYYGELLTQDRPLPAEALILDLGCGYGRIALDLVPRLTDQQIYVGLDPNAEAVEWATRNIAARWSNFSFHRIDVVSGPYNPDGTVTATEFRFPFDDDTLDLVFMISVMTHVDLATVEAYVREASRTLKPDTGRLVATFFLLDDEVESLLAAGRSPFRMPWRAGESRVENRDEPELAIAHPRERVLQILREAGFARTTVFEGSWSGRSGTREMDYQDLVIGDLRAVAEVAPPGRSLDADSSFGDTGRLLAARGVTPESLAPFLEWAATLSLNGLWWERSGIELELAEEGRSIPGRVLDTAMCRELGFSDAAPDGAASGAFLAFDESAILAGVAAASASTAAVFGFIHEVVGNGIRVDDALRAGGTVRQRRRDGTAPEASIPSSPLAR